MIKKAGGRDRAIPVALRLANLRRADARRIPHSNPAIGSASTRESGGIMASDSESAEPEKVTIEGIVIDRWKVKLPSVFMSLPADFFPHVGLIVVSWGSFETMFDNLLTALLVANKKEPTDVRRLELRKRFTRCREESVIALAPLVGTIAYLKSILDDAPALYMKRNFLVHGQMGTAAALPSTEIPQLRAFLETHHPTYPNPSNLPPLPQSSRS